MRAHRRLLRGAALIRPVRDEDADGIIALIGGCWAEYPGCIMDVDGENPELRAFATHAARKGGAAWVEEREGAIVGLAATWPLGYDEAWEIARIYVAKPARGTGLAHTLLDLAEARAREAGAERLVLWTDTRFEAAHHFYEKRSYVRAGSIRILDDRSRSLEFRYAKPLAPLAVEALDAAAAASAEHRLARVLADCVNAGASLAFRAPLSIEAAHAHWHKASAEVAAGTRLLLGAWADGVLAGAVMLDLATPPNQPHRAEIQTLLVHPDYRRRGIAHALMERAAQTASRVNRRLLTVSTPEGGAGEALFRSLGWAAAGRIPGYVLDADGTPRAGLFFYATPA